MIYFRKEGEAVRNGLNIYPRSDEWNAGFVLRIWKRMFFCRYLKIRKVWSFMTLSID